MVYHPKSVRVLGIAQMIIGSAMFIFGVLYMFFVRQWSSTFACGMWIGIWVGMTGMFGYLGAKSNNNPINSLIGLMIGFAVISCILAAIMLIIQSIAVAQFAERLRCPKDQNERSTPHYWEYDKCEKYNTYYPSAPSYFEAQKGAAIGSLLLILAVVEFFVAFISSIYGCNSCTCCCPATPRPSQPAAQQVAYLQQPGGNLILIRAGGGIPPGAILQTITTQPGQQEYVVSPHGYPAQAYQASPTDTHNKPEEDLPPAYDSVVQ